jgi:hypothetical protein
MCGSEDVVEDRREGHVVCNNCGTVLELWTVCEQTYEASTRTSAGPERVERAVALLDRRRPDNCKLMKSKIESLVMHAGFGTAVVAMSHNMCDVLEPSSMPDKEIVAWAIVTLACDACRASRPINDVAAMSGVSTGALIAARNALRPALARTFFQESVSRDSVDETLASMNVVLSELLPTSAMSEKFAARRYVLRRAEGLASNASFMNVRPATRARVLLMEYYKVENLPMTAVVKHVLKAASSGVRVGLKKISGTS